MRAAAVLLSLSLNPLARVKLRASATRGRGINTQAFSFEALILFGSVCSTTDRFDVSTGQRKGTLQLELLTIPVSADTKQTKSHTAFGAGYPKLVGSQCHPIFVSSPFGSLS